MAELLYRATPADLCLRADGRTVYGLAVPYDQETEIVENGRRFTEVFRRGAFARTIADRMQKVRLAVNHGKTMHGVPSDLYGQPIGRAISLSEETPGLVGEFRISDTRAGNEALELIHDGVFDAFSVGFVPVKGGDRISRGGLVERIEVALREVSLTSFPAYAGAVIGGVRSQGPHLTAEDARKRLAALTPHLTADDARERLALIERTRS